MKVGHLDSQTTISFDFYGVTLTAVVPQKFIDIIKRLNRDFGYFNSEAATSAQKIDSASKISIQILFSDAQSETFNEKGFFTFFKSLKLQVSEKPFSSERICDYGGGLKVRFRENHFQISGANIDHIYEATYMAILSAVGEGLDKMKMHRVHAAAFSYGNRIWTKTVLVLLPQGGGKSSMAAILKNDLCFKIFSDESPLLKNAVLYSNPFRLALEAKTAQVIGLKTGPENLFIRKHYKPKHVFQIENSEVAKTSPLDIVLIGKLWPNDPVIRKCSRPFVFLALFKNMVIGFGLAQMTQYFVRKDNIFTLFQIAYSRISEAIIISRRAQHYQFLVSKDAFKNAAHLKEFMRSQIETKSIDDHTLVSELKT
jgi:hypothetical protein